MMPLLKIEQGVTDELKMSNQFEWVGEMNSIVAQIEEVIYRDIIDI